MQQHSNKQATIRNHTIMSAPQQQQQQQMLLQKNVLTAYLQPLLTKHEEQKPITYEDLIASWQAATAALARERATNTPAHISSMVRACVPG